MAKQSGKSGVVLVGGINFSAQSLQWDANLTTNPSDITGFGDGSHNSIHGLKSGEMTVNMLWDSSDKTETLETTTEQSNVTIIPGGYSLGAPSFSMPFYQANFDVSGNAAGDALQAGSIKFITRGNVGGLELGQVLHHDTITGSTSDIGINDPNQGTQEITAKCAGVMHVWDATNTDTYVVKIQESTDNATWADLITFTLNGTALGSERVERASANLEPYRRVIATRTGAAGDTFGFTVHFWHEGG
jgi:hypothetical protein